MLFCLVLLFRPFRLCACIFPRPQRFVVRVLFPFAFPTLLPPSRSLTRVRPPLLPRLSARVFNSRYVAQLKDISFLDEAAVCVSEADQTRSGKSAGATTCTEEELLDADESGAETASAAPVSAAAASAAAASAGAERASAPTSESEETEREAGEELFIATTAAAQREAHSDRFPHEGFTSLVIARLASPLAGQVRLSQTVNSVSQCDESGERRVVLRTRRGGEFSARHVIFALPLGVLKGRHVETRVTFNPPLAAPKRAAIRSLGFGTENKVILQFHPEDIFWDKDEHYLQCTDIYVRFVNLHCFDQPGVIVAFVSPPYSHLMMDDDDDRGCRTAGYVLAILYKMCVAFVIGFVVCSSPLPPSLLLSSHLAFLFLLLFACSLLLSPLPHRYQAKFKSISWNKHNTGTARSKKGKRVKRLARPRTCFPSTFRKPRLERVFVTQWGDEAHTMGSYSFVKTGASFLPCVRALAKPDWGEYSSASFSFLLLCLVLFVLIFSFVCSFFSSSFPRLRVHRRAHPLRR